MRTFGFFSFRTLNIPCFSHLTCRVSGEKSANSLMGIPFYVICCFPLVAFNIFSLHLSFINLIIMCLGVFPLGFILYVTLHFLDWMTVSFPVLGKFSTKISSNIFSGPSSFSYSGTPIIKYWCV